ncbi:hypothetical protein [Pseudomonas cichorii]|uniref:hypothetical protein n=1 Tax=Pseudomonas cichorii TaxID=36746 RepID=UPI001C89C823|nr:hypothetical protein [Pseudomonas cichorii]MBX8528707.1 hypothetical protein [Pseudomonas cichorii]MBX8574130.1 hypothetical protein [Pseudomonas cichorii]
MPSPTIVTLYLLLTYVGPILLNLGSKKPKYITAWLAIHVLLFCAWTLNQY